MSSFTNLKIWLWLGCFTHKFPALTAVCFLLSFIGSMIVPRFILSAGSWLSVKLLLWTIPLGILFLSGMGLIFSIAGHNWQVAVLIAQKFLKTHPQYNSKLEDLIAEMRQAQDSNLRVIQWINVKEELKKIEEKRQMLKDLEEKLII